jgi:methylated-DNA-[protein]-cysteine S-methyltransferase
MPCMANATDERYACRMSICYIDSPVGRLALEAEGDALTGLRWATEDERSRGKSAPVLNDAARQLDRYFKGKLRRFDLKIAPHGTDYQKRVWAAMRKIAFGKIATYGGIAMTLDSGPRAVGMACGANPMVIITPCHRVLASGGAIGGYGGVQGVAIKRKLLAIEGVVLS